MAKPTRKDAVPAEAEPIEDEEPPDLLVDGVAVSLNGIEYRMVECTICGATILLPPDSEGSASCAKHAKEQVA